MHFTPLASTTQLVRRSLLPALLLHIAGTMRAQEPIDAVDPFIGTAHAAHNFPGALVPWGMVSVSPHTDLRSPSGYYAHSPNTLYGFGHVHLSGVGCYDLANIALMPTTGALRTARTEFSSTISRERASPGFYSCRIDRYGVDAAMTATERAGLSSYRFAAATDSASILIDVSQGVSASQGGFVRVVSPAEVEGWNVSGRFCTSPTHQRVHFVARFSRPALSTGLWSESVSIADDTVSGASIGAALRFRVDAGDSILVKVGISYTSIENARRNLDEEIPDWSFDRVHRAARARWSEELGRIRVSGGTEDQRTMFYTAMFRAMVHPNLFHDVSGDYRRFGDNGTGRVDGYDRYTVFSLWDSYRTLHPLLSIAWPRRQSDMARTIVEKFRESGWLPKWSLMGMDAFSMSGDPAVIVLADTWAKGIRDFDLWTGFRGMLRSAGDDHPKNWIRPGLASYMRYGHIPPDRHSGQWYTYGPTSTSLEYYLADAMIARVAAELCLPEEYLMFTERSGDYEHLWDSTTRFFRPRNGDGTWSEPWDPAAIYPEDKYYTEGSAYHYRYFLPHDIAKLIELHGGERAFVSSLQRFFDDGTFQWNEHNLAYPYLFTYVDGESWRTHGIVRDLLKQMRPLPGGIETNEDAGVISAWYILSAIGIYPVEYGTDRFQIGSPIFDTVTITPARPGARPFVITAAGTSDARRFVSGALLDGRPLERTHLRMEEIVAGGQLDLSLSTTRSNWGTALRPPDAMSATATVVPHAVHIDLTWRPRPGASLVRVQVASDPTFCSPLHDTLLSGTDGRLAVDVSPSRRSFWWRTATVDAHGAAAWSRAIEERLTGLPVVVGNEHSGVGLSLADGRALVRLPANRDATLVVYDLLGREVARTTLEAHRLAYPTTIDLSHLTHGVYLCRLDAGGESISIPFVAR